MKSLRLFFYGNTADAHRQSFFGTKPCLDDSVPKPSHENTTKQNTLNIIIL